MRSIILTVFGAFFPAFLAAQATGPFFSTFTAERGDVLAPATDGRLWLGGMLDERVLLVKLSPGGNLVERHSIGFQGANLDADHLTDLFEDGDGMLVGCGYFELDNAGRGFVFRYNPVSRKMVWSHIVRSDLNFIHGITEIGPGGDFVLYGNPHAVAGEDGELIRLNRLTGQILPNQAKRYSLGTSDDIAQAVYHKGALYTCGRFSNDNGFSNFSRMRHALCKVDTGTLEPVWSRISPLPTATPARLYGRDLIIDDEAIVSTLSGDATGPGLLSSTIFLQKNDLNGNLLWARQYNLPEWNGEFAEEVISLPDGYLLYGHDLLSDTSRLFLLKTDKKGAPLGAVKIDVDYNEDFPFVPARSKILRLGNALFFTAMSQNNAGQTQGILGKIDLNAWDDDSCDFFSKTPVHLVTMPAPVSEAVVPFVTVGPATLEGANVSLTTPDLTVDKACSAGGTCPTLPDLQLHLDSFSCGNGNPRLYYSFCNAGGQVYEGSTFFGLYDKNPFTEDAKLVTYVIHAGESIQPGDCSNWSVGSNLVPPNVFLLDTFPKLYGMIGMHPNMSIPVSPDDFPFDPNRPECGYINNLDSIAVPAGLCDTSVHPVACPDVAFSVNTIYCSADSALFYKARVCNTGDAPFSGPFEVTFFDKNPLIEAAQPVWSVAVNTLVEPGKCAELSWPLPGTASQYTKLYSLAGVGSNTATPVDPGNFPFSQGFAECTYGNNLDSFVVRLPVCDGCENPTTFFKTMGRVDRSEQGYSLCTASDGNVYLAGRQGRNPMIAKMNTNGQMIWVRNFPADTFLETVEMVEIFEDSEGMLVLCGTEGLSPNSRIAVAMRYDPVADQVLWFKQYPEQNPQALGIFEKTPGGNLILYSFSDEYFTTGGPFGGFYRARSEVWELDRTTGEVVPTLATLFGGDPSVYFQDMVPHNGSFYSVGGWSNNGQGRMLLTKLSADDGTPYWLQGTIPDTTLAIQFIGCSNILVDSEQLVVLGYGALNLGAPDQINFIYLSKYTLDGALLWMKSYQIALAVEDIVALPEGYALFGRMEGNSWVMIKTDKDGNVLVAKKITLPIPAGTTLRYYRQNQLLRLPEHLLMVDDYKDAVFDDLVLIKTDYDFNLDDSCGLLQDIPLIARVQPARAEPIGTPFQPYAVVAVGAQTAFLADSLNTRLWCPQCPCLDKPDITYHIDSVYCSAAAGVVADIRICNLGQVSSPAGFDLTFYDKNPLTTAATPLYSMFVADQPGFADCIRYTVSLDSALLPASKIYTLAGLWGDVQTPVSLDNFPFPNGFAECDYANNLDSFELVLPVPVPPALGSDQVVCAGQTVMLDAGAGYVAYQWANGPATRTFPVSTSGIYPVAVTDVCGRTLHDTVQVAVLPPVAPTTVTILFYPGDTVLIGGTAYTQPGPVVQTLTSATGCDSLVTTVLELVNTTVQVQCPADLTATLPLNQPAMPVNYTLPAATTDCPDPNVDLKRLQGPPSGGAFSLGVTQVCYEAANQCGIRDTCCFTVTVLPSDDLPCDVKAPSGCLRYELLDIRFDALGQRRYRVRITNTCASRLQYVYIQLPKGVTAVSPADGSIYATNANHSYTVRQPNASLFYSIRYKVLAGGLSNGESDIFEYLLPQQSAPDYIHVAARLADGSGSETHLNTFNCPVQPYLPLPVAGEREMFQTSARETPVALAVRPNPSSGQLFVGLGAWAGEPVYLQVFDARGQRVLERHFDSDGEWFDLDLPGGLTNGLYYLSVQGDRGRKSAARFVLAR